MFVYVHSMDNDVNIFFPFRYRNFRTFASPRPAQFSCLALESSGEIVAAGSVNSFEIFIWSMQTGRLLEVRDSVQYLPELAFSLLFILFGSSGNVQ